MPTVGDAVTALVDARERTFELVGGLPRADLERALDPIMSPLVWDLAHIAAYEDLWLCHRHGGLELLRPDLAAMYDAFETPRAVRGDLPLLDEGGARDYLERVRERALRVLRDTGPGDGTLLELVLRHEQQHGETMLQAIEMAQLEATPDLARRANGQSAPAQPLTGLEQVRVDGGTFLLGAGPEGFAYDNERPRHQVELPSFRIGRAPVTNATFLHFVEGGGYVRREWWSDEGWAWKEQYDITHPAGWSADRRTRWRLDGWVPLDPHAPVAHVSWFEADAFARAHGARLPTEAEWEKAATWDQTAQAPRPPAPEQANVDHVALEPRAPTLASPSGALGMIGDVWEWTSTAFDGYPGFRAHPYREYSEVFFGSQYKVLRGGSWATRARNATATFRNWDLPLRRQIFAGFRLAWDD